MRRILAVLISFFLIYTFLNNDVHGHGRMLEPPNRSSLWRLAKYEDLDPPVEVNYDDDQLYCGSFGNMINNGGKCGVCGDPWELPQPRDNENGGLYGQALVVRNYKVGQVIDIAVELTTNHWGYFVWHLCKLEDPSQPEPENCFDQLQLPLADESGFKYNLTHNSRGWFNTTIKLPNDLQCDRCVLRWHYRAGNNWEFCGDDKELGSTDCGYQEVFRSCSDISIGSSKPLTMRPKLTTTTEVEADSDQNEPSNKATIPPMRPPINGKLL